MIEIRFRLAMHDGWGGGTGEGETLLEAVREAAMDADSDLEQCRDITVDWVKVGGRTLDQDAILKALATHSDFTDTQSLVALVKDYQVLREVQDKAVPMLEGFR